MTSRARHARPRSRRTWALLLAALSVSPAACGEGALMFPEDDESASRVTQLHFVDGAAREILGGRRSPDPFRVQASDALGERVAGATVEFQVTGTGGGILSQPRAVTDSLGMAETWLLDARSGPAILHARAGSAAITMGLEIVRAPGEIVFEDASGAVGLPSKPHPDSIVRVRVLDTEGVPLGGVPVFFSGPPGLSAFSDTTDREGWASTVVRRAAASAGDGDVFAFILDFPELTTSALRPVEAAARRVVLVSVDGLRADALERYHPPTLNRLAAEAAFTSRARTVLPSLTAPAHLSLFSSVPPDGHGIFGDDIQYTQEMASLDPLFRHGARSGLHARAFMARDSPLEQLEVALGCRLAFGLDSLTLVDPGADRIVEAALPTLADPEVEMVFVHLPDPDMAGHAHGFESPEYRDAVLRADAALAELVEVLGPETLLVVTSDHGGGGAFGSHQHGSGSEEDVRIPLLFHGPRVVPGADPGEASILDVAPTILWSLGLAPPFDYEGEILLDLFR